MGEPKQEMDPVAKKRARLFARAVEVFSDEDNARLWISQPHPELDDLPPVAFAHTDDQVARVLAILDRIEFGIYA